MAREPRIEVPGGIYHVSSRGNRGCKIYTDDFERRVFLMLLARVVARELWTVHAYCLMSNHYHLLVQIEYGGLSSGMQLLNGEFARIANRRHGQEGHLFRNRFWSEAVVEERRMLATARYIVLNPVRAGICVAPEDWRWSSYRACAGLDFVPGFLAAQELLGLFARSPAAARRAYRGFVRAGMASSAGVRHRDESRARSNGR